MSLSVGDIAPNFTLPSTEGKDFNLHVDAKGAPSILYFYPKDFTQVCTEQACAFRDYFGFFQKLGVKVLGINKDDLATHKKFKEEHQLPFELLTDASGEVCRQYDSLIPIVGVVSRNTYILDKNLRIAAIHKNLFANSSEIRRLVEKLKDDIQ
jgi:thioredoxin-dependent peroxiredoxin